MNDKTSMQLGTEKTDNRITLYLLIAYAARVTVKKMAFKQQREYS